MDEPHIPGASINRGWRSRRPGRPSLAAKHLPARYISSSPPTFADLALGSPPPVICLTFLQQEPKNFRKILYFVILHILFCLVPKLLKKSHTTRLNMPLRWSHTSVTKRLKHKINKAVYNLDSELNPKNSWNDTNIEFNHVRVVQQV